MSITHTSGVKPRKTRNITDPSVFREGNPWRVVIDLNEVCNLKCTYCHINSLSGIKAKTSRTLDPKLVKSLLHDADQMKVFDITLTGGEILIMPNFVEYLEGVKDLSFSSVQLITNGICLSKKLAKEIKKSGVQRVSISIDSLEASNDQARGNGVWKRAWKGLENAVNSKLTVNVISVLGKHNIDDWYKLPALLKKKGVRSQNISLMCRLGRAESSKEWLGVPVERLYEIHSKIKRLQKELNDDKFFLSFNDGVLKHLGWSGKSTPLHAFQDQNPGIEAVVKVDGTVLRNRLYGKDHTVGNLNTTSLSTLWQKDKLCRKQLKEVTGTGNAGNLPNLYYHYNLIAERPRLANKHNKETDIHRCSNDIRVREESWGKIIFDCQTFSILHIRLGEDSNE